MGLEGKVVGGRWVLTKLLGSGSFGQIYIAKALADDSTEVAVKLEMKNTKHPQLVYEAKLLKLLQGSTGIAEVYHYSVEEEHTVMVMELMGPSLEDVFNICKRSLSVKSTVMLADEMLRRIEFFHSKHYIHRDIKPDNFLIGRGQKSNIVYIIDFGLAKKYRNPVTGVHGPYRENKNLTGTARYASLNAHLGIEQSRRDDLEAIGFVLVYFLKGSLPWQGIKAQAKLDKYGAIMDKKLSTPIQTLCADLPPEFATYLEYTRNLRFDEEPDYKYMRWLFQRVFRREQFDNDGCFDWNVVKVRPQWQVDERKKERAKREGDADAAVEEAGHGTDEGARNRGRCSTDVTISVGPSGALASSTGQLPTVAASGRDVVVSLQSEASV
eukprot:TRINITY_DN50705_c0_g1_i1.p1 TRINITY_DN50705_c0_g1~~TRINITY_DN50705_c0_g1_i1.p1  ORF type:complete len:382 (+),score=76.34 TRINITY_DN50705_c0_g1_i1:91-1236(+)